MADLLTRTPEPSLLVDSREAARLLCLCERSVWTLTKAGKLRAIRVGRSVRYSRQTLLDYIRRAEAGQ